MGVSLRQSYARVGKLALVKQQRYAHAKRFKRARRSLKTLKTFLGRVIRDIVRKIRGDEALKNVFAHPLMLARRVRAQNKNLRRVKGAPEGADLRVFSLHAPEVECIGKGKAHKPYEFGVKASLATTLKRSKGGQFIVHAKALPGKPYDGHTLAAVIPEIERLVGADLERIIADRGYRGHNAPPPHRFKVYVSGQKRRVTEKIKRELRRRAAIEPVIGHLKAEHRMGRNHLAHATGDAGNAILAAVGYNFRRLLAWLALLLTLIAAALASRNLRRSAIIPLQTAIFTGDYFFDIKTEALGVDRAIEDPWRVDTVMAKCGQEGHRLPMAIRHLGVEPLPASAPAAQRGHIGLGPSFVDEDEAFGIDPPLIALPARPFAGDVGTLLLARKHGFF
jgi:IS5 family transposase